MSRTLLALVATVFLAAWCWNAWSRRWRPYDPTWLVELAREQHPDDPSLTAALRACTRAIQGANYVRFVSGRRANQPGAEWQFARNVTLESDTHGDLVLDVLQSGRIGGVEFLSKLLARGG